MAWMQLCRKYLVDLTVEQMFCYYHLLLQRGMKVLNQIMEKGSAGCVREALLGRILEVRRLMEGVRGVGGGVNPQLLVSLDRGEEITL